MPIARLSIDLEARLAGLQQGLDKAGFMAAKQAEKIEKAFSFGNIAKGVAGGTILANVLQDFGRRIVQFVPQVIDGLDALNDMSDATGASIENLSALEDVALRTGTSVETISSALIKMNKTLSDAKPGTDQAQVFKNLGLSVEELQKLDPVEAFQRLAVALNGYQNNATKATYTQELFQKSLREVAPLLKDAAEKGRLQATVTADAAAAAEQLNKNWNALKKDVLDLSRALAGPLVSGLNSVAEAMRGISKERESGKGWWDSLNLALARKMPQFAFGAQKAQLLGTDQPNARGTFLRSDKDTTQVDLPTLAKLPDQDALKKAIEKARKLREDAARAIVDVEEQAAADTAAAWGYWEQQILAQQKERVDAEKEQWKQVFEFIDAEQERAIEQGQQMLDAQEEMAKRSAELGKDIGLVFTSAAGDAIREWQGFRNLLDGIGKDLLQLALKRMVTDPLDKALGSVFSGFNVGNIFSSMFGGARAGGGPVEAGKAYLVGEKRPELFVPRSSGTIVPSVGGGGAPVFNLSIDARGADPGVELRLHRAVEKLKAQIPSIMVAAANRDALVAKAVGRR
jgi:hypothetical protein